MKYVGQTGRTFNARYKDNIYIKPKSDNSNTRYSRHVLDTGHAYGTMWTSLELVKRDNI
jgi:hypothetical protein